MKLKEIIEFLDKKIPKDIALENDNIGFQKEYDLNQDINSVKIYMDLFPKNDNNNKNTLIITHHPPLFTPDTPTYTIHSNWDIICGGANESLAETLNLEVESYFDDKLKIGRVCIADCSFNKLKENILRSFDDVRIVNTPKKHINKVGIVSGFGLKNTDYIKLASDKKLDILISGDLTQETAILAKNLDLTLIDLGHHNSEVPGLYKLATVLNELNLNCEVIDTVPIKRLTI